MNKRNLIIGSIIVISAILAIGLLLLQKNGASGSLAVTQAQSMAPALNILALAMPTAYSLVLAVIALKRM
ncbi:MAG: hypothetical protein ACYCZF_06010 [Anaerolineae bacterium]